MKATGVTSVKQRQRNITLLVMQQAWQDHKKKFSWEEKEGLS